jgi:hypothetical protein
MQYARTEAPGGGNGQVIYEELASAVARPLQGEGQQDKIKDGGGQGYERQRIQAGLLFRRLSVNKKLWLPCLFVATIMLKNNVICQQDIMFIYARCSNIILPLTKYLAKTRFYLPVFANAFNYPSHRF